MTRSRAQRIILLAAALLAWWLGDRFVNPWAQLVLGLEQIHDPDVRVVLGHWFAWQLPGTLVCLAVWFLGWRLALLPSLSASLGSGGGSWRRVAVSGAAPTTVLLLIVVAVGAAAGGSFGLHPYVPKMIGDLASNLYEEIVYRGLLFCAFYGVAAATTFPLNGKVNKLGVIVAILGSSVVFAAGHTQYSLALRVGVGIAGIIFAWPWIRARSLWSPWLVHTLTDVIGDSIVKL